MNIGNNSSIFLKLSNQCDQISLDILKNVDFIYNLVYLIKTNFF